MKRFNDFFRRKKVVVMIASGGVGEFLFQLDLAKRLEVEGINTVFFVKKKYILFSEIVQISTVKNAKLISLEKFKLIGLTRFKLLCLFQSVILINSFNSIGFSFITRMLYFIVRFYEGRVLVCKKDIKDRTSFETLYYGDQEVIWERNNRIVEYITKNKSNLSFPILFSEKQKETIPPYIYIHPVGSNFSKSYPVKKLIKLFSLRKDINWIFTVTPGEEKWYLTEELKNFLKENENITFQSKNFKADEVVSFMTGSKLFITVNTGLLWLAGMLEVKTIVADTFTDFEWNPSFCKNITRLSHDYDEKGESLHLVLKDYPDGKFFESMYLVEPEEINDAISKNLN